MLDYIEITNFRSCEHVRLQLGEPVVALLGKNGAGKTNLLHAIQLAAELCVGEAEPLFSLHPRDPARSTTFEIKFSIDSAAFVYRTSRSVLRKGEAVFEESLTKGRVSLFDRKGEEIDVPLSNLPHPIRLGTNAATLPTLLQILPMEDPATAELIPVANFLRSVNYYSLQQGFQEHFAAPPRMSTGDLWADSSTLIDVTKYEAWKSELEQGRARRSVQLRLLHLYLEDQPSFQELKVLLGDSGLGLLADIQIEKVRLTTISSPKRSEKEEDEEVEGESETHYLLRFIPGGSLAGAGRPFRFNGLSAGTWRILQLLTYLVFDKNSCMLLEQPEDSIHPGLLAKVMDILQTYSGRTQLICTTHSPRVMNLIGPRGIRLVTTDNGNTSVNTLSNADLVAVESYLQDEGTLAEFLEIL